MYTLTIGASNVYFDNPALLNQEFYGNPEPKEIKLEEVYAFAGSVSSGVTMEVVEIPEGERILPPENNVEKLSNYSPDEKRLRYERQRQTTKSDDYSDVKEKLEKLFLDDDDDNDNDDDDNDSQ